MTEDNNIHELKLKLNSAKRRKLKNEREEFVLRAKERSLIEQLALLSSESESILRQTEDLKHQIVQTKYQISMIDICAASEKAKLENHYNIIKSHKESFESLFAEESEKNNARNERSKIRRAEAEEEERKKQAKIQETIEIKTKDAIAIEEESIAIEKECSILVKRNKAIMIQLRRKLIEAEDVRRELMKRK